MCNVKTGADVKHKGDLQNLITSVILRQSGVFTKDDVIDGVRAKLQGSVYVDNGEVIQRIEDTLHQLFIINCLICDGKQYQLSMSFPAVTKR